MKFYKDKYNWNFLNKIEHSELSSIYQSYINSIEFFKNGKLHNYKNASYIFSDYTEFHLNGTYYGDQDDFDKESWRKFAKLQAFL
jgi:hypothetical protein